MKTKESFPAHAVSQSLILEGRDYLPMVLNDIENAQNRFWASIFLVDVRLPNDPRRSVRELLQRLSYRQWQNVDVRILVGQSPIYEIQAASLSAYYYMRELGISARLFDSAKQDKSHSKFIIVDSDVAIIGSSNWTDDAFHHGVENSLRLSSPDINYALAQDFTALWDSSKEMI